MEVDADAPDPASGSSLLQVPRSANTLTEDMINQLQALSIHSSEALPAIPNQGLQTFRISDSDFQAMMQAEILAHFDLVQACQVLGSPAKELAPRSSFKSMEDIRAWLQLAGYKISSDNHWEVLGIARLSKPRPDQNGVLARGRFARALVSIALYSGWNQDELDKAQRVNDKLDNSIKKCIEELEKSPVPIREQSCFPFLPFGELGQDGLDLLSKKLPEGSWLATQFSDIMDLAGREAISLKQRREISETLEMNPQTAAVPWVPWKGLAGWAPADGGALGRLLTWYTAMGDRGFEPWPLILITPVPVPFGCASWEEVKGVWRHTMIGTRWAPSLSELCFVETPVKMIAPCQGNPSVSWKHLAIATFEFKGGPTRYESIKIREPLARAVQGKGFFVDGPADAALRTRRAVAAVLGGMKWSSSPQGGSPGSSPEAPRFRNHFIIGAGQISDFDLEAIILRLRDGLGAGHFLVAEDTVFKDPSSLLMGFTSLDAIFKVTATCTDIALVNKSLAVIRTNRTPEQWKMLLDDIFSTDPLCSVSGVRWKPGMHGGRWWASPLLLIFTPTL